MKFLKFAIFKVLYFDVALTTLSVLSDRVQELDGGFFEKFGSLLQEETQRSDDCAVLAVRKTQLLGSAPGASPCGDPCGDDPALAEALEGAGDAAPVDMSGPGRMDTSDSETEEAVKQEVISDVVGWNVSSTNICVYFYIRFYTS